MSYKSGAARKYTGGAARGAAATTAVPQSEQVYFLSYNVGTKEAPEYITVGNIQQYADSKRLVMSLNTEHLEKLPANDKGWINGINVRESKLEKK